MHVAVYTLLKRANRGPSLKYVCRRTSDKREKKTCDFVHCLIIDLYEFRFYPYDFILI